LRATNLIEEPKAQTALELLSSASSRSRVSGDGCRSWRRANERASVAAVVVVVVAVERSREPIGWKAATQLVVQRRRRGRRRRQRRGGGRGIRPTRVVGSERRVASILFTLVGLSELEQIFGRQHTQQLAAPRF
jgi:hypothetical protein